MAASKTSTTAITSAESLITGNLDIWTSAIKQKASTGRGSSKKQELYGIKKLRELILELAVRGLLVPQDPNDEPASVLLEKIAAEKEQLIKEGKLKKQKPLPKVTDEEKPFELPEGWEFVRLGELAVLRSGLTFSKDRELEFGKYPYCRVGDMNLIENSIELTTSSKFIDPLEKDLSQLIPLNSIAFPKRGGAIATNKKRYVNKPLFVDLNVMAVTPIGDISLTYFMTWLESIDLATLNTGTSVPQINNKDIYPLIFPAPPKAEQPRIVAKVNELMALCDQLEQKTESSLAAHQTLVETLLNSLLEAAKVYPGHASSTAISGVDAKNDPFQMAWQQIWDNFDLLFTTEQSIDQLKQTILQLAVMGKLVPQDPEEEPASVLLEKIAAEKEQLIKDKKIKKQKALPPISEDEKPFTLPEGWEWCRLPDIGDLARGKSKHRPRNDPSLYINGNIPLVQTGDVSRANGIIESYTALYNEAGLAQSRLWPKGTMCITIAANIADTSVLGFDACFPDSVVGYTPFDKEIDVRYFEFFIRTAKSDLEKYAPSTAQKNINLEILGQVLVPFPPKKEIARIVTKIDKLMALCEMLKLIVRESKATQHHIADTIAEQVLKY